MPDIAASALTTGRVTVNGTAVAGAIEVSSDSDWFALNLVAGVAYTLRMNRVGTSSLDPILELRNGAGGLISSNDDGGIGLNSLLNYTPTVSGTYYLAGRGYGTTTGSYTVSAATQDDFSSNTATSGTVTANGAARTGRIEVGGDADWFETTLTAGTTYLLRMNAAATNGVGDPLLELRNSAGALITSNDDAPGEGLNSLITYTATVSGTSFLGARGYSVNTQPGAYTVSVASIGADDYAASTATAGTVAVNGSRAGRIESAGDQDWFRVSLDAGVTYILRADTAATGGVGDPVLGLRNSAGALITSNDDGGNGYNSLISYTPPASGTYYLAAGGYGAATGAYVVSVSVSDDFAASTATTGHINVNGAAGAGRIERLGDADWFATTLTAGVSYELRLDAAAVNGLDDPFLELRNAAGSIITTDDDGGGGLDSLITFTAGTSGTYYLAARDLENGSTGGYTVSVASTLSDDHAATTATTGVVPINGSAGGNIETAGDTDWFAIQLTAGQVYTINLEGDILADPYFRGAYTSSGILVAGTANDDFGNSFDSRVTFTPGATGTYYLAAGAYGTETGTYFLSVTTNAPVTDIAASTATTATLAVNGVARSVISPGADVDWFRVSLTGGQRYVIDENASSIAGPALADAFFRGIYNAAGTLIPGTSNDDYGTSLDSRVSFTAPTTGTYYLAAGGFGNHTGGYSLSLARVQGTVDAVGNTAVTAGTIAVDGSINGSVDVARDVDWYRVTLTAGHDYAIEVRGAPSGAGSLSDPSLVGIYRANGAIVAGTAAASGPGTIESESIFSPTASGTYYLAVGGDSDGTGTYRLSVRESEDNLDIPANTTTAAVVAVGGNLVSAVDGAGDIDWIRVQLTAGVQYRIDERGMATGDGTLDDPRIIGVYNATGQALQNSANDDSGGTYNASVTITAPQTGTYFIAAGAYQTDTGTYKVSVTPVAVDTSGPLLLSTLPADNATAVPVSGNLSLGFNEAVRAGSGTITITGGGTTRQISVTDTQQVSFNGEIMTINPSANLAAGTAYRVTMAPGTVEDLAGNDFAGISSATQFNFTTAAGGAVNAADKWTVMVYMAADNNLEPYGIGDLNEMEMPTLPANVNVVTLVDRAPGFDASNGDWTDTRRGSITHDNNTSTVSSALTSLGELNTGSGATLTQFIDWAAANNPAQHYALIIWDHGGGLSGTAWDDSSGDNLRGSELVQAIDNSSVARFDLIGFDACLQAMVEQVWDLRNLADVVVGSEELEPGPGWDYDQFLAQLAANPDMSSSNLASAIVSTYTQSLAGYDDITLSATRTNAMAALDNALDQFVAAVGPNPSGAVLTGLRTAAAHATELDPSGFHHYRDLGDFMDEVVANVASATIDAAATAVANAVDNAVIARGGTVADANGLSIYLPFGTDFVDPSYTPANHSFLASSNWDSFLQII